MKPSLLNDILFKIVFGSDRSEFILRPLLNALLGLTGPQRILHLNVTNPTLPKTYFQDKGVILDVSARDEAGRRYNIEVQLRSKDDYIQRSLYYLARLFGQQLKKGKTYDKLPKTVGISLLGFILFDQRKELHSCFQLFETQELFRLTDIFELHYVELPKFKTSEPGELHTPFEKWLYALKFSEQYADPNTPLPASIQEEEGIPMALESMRKAYARDEVRDLMLAQEKYERDQASRLQHATKDAEEKGIQKGIEKGIEKGKLEAQRALAKRLLAIGMPPEQVADLSGLPLQEIRALESPSR